MSPSPLPPRVQAAELIEHRRNKSRLRHRNQPRLLQCVWLVLMQARNLQEQAVAFVGGDLRDDKYVSNNYNVQIFDIVNTIIFYKLRARFTLTLRSSINIQRHRRDYSNYIHWVCNFLGWGGRKGEASFFPFFSIINSVIAWRESHYSVRHRA